MGLFSFLLTSSLLHSTQFVSGRWETGLDADLYGEIPRPTNEPVPYRDEFNQRAVLMDTRLGYQRNVTSRADLSLAARQQTCDPGYINSCPPTRAFPCCPQQYPICCNNTASSTCCPTGSVCVGIASCCPDGGVGCTSPEGCCPGGTTCCGIWCCGKGYECHFDDCVNLALSSRSIASIASVASESSQSVAATQHVYGNGNGSSNAALVGGVVGGVLGAVVLGLFGILLWRRNRAASTPPSVAPSAALSSAQQPFFGQQPSSLPISPASQTFSMSSNHTSVPPVTYAPQPAWPPQQLAPVTLPGAAGPPTTGQTAPASQQSPSNPYSVRTWVDLPHQGNYGGYMPQS